MFLIDFILHIGDYIGNFIELYGAFTYAILFLVIFIETGLVIMPFLPGDSLIFAAGAFVALGQLNYFWVYILLIIAAVAGDNINYLIGKKIGQKIIESKKVKYLNEKNLNKAHDLINKHGAKAVLLARFMPIIRTIVPFIAGMGEMDHKRFTVYNFIGGIIWVTLFINLGYFFGNTEVVQENFTLIILAIIAISLLPIAIEIIRNMIKSKK